MHAERHECSCSTASLEYIGIEPIKSNKRSWPFGWAKSITLSKRPKTRIVNGYELKYIIYELEYWCFTRDSGHWEKWRNLIKRIWEENVENIWPGVWKKTHNKRLNELLQRPDNIKEILKRKPGTGQDLHTWVVNDDRH